jgi:hypothetical protein
VTSPADIPSDGPRWSFNFTTWTLGTAMQTGVIYDAVDGSEPVVGYAQSCNTTLGDFRVDEMSATGGDGGIGTLESFTAAFTFTCDGSPGALRGCVHYGP